MRDVAITGVGSTSFGKHDGRGLESLAVDAANTALKSAGVERKEIGALYLGNFIAGPLSGQEVLAGIVADELGLENIPCTKVEGACASGGIAFRHAVLSVAAGLCDAALVVGVEKMTHASGGQVTQALNCAMDNRSDGPSGLTFPGLFGLAWRIHAAKYGTTRDEVSAVVIKNKANGLKNPLAQLGANLSLDIIRQSQMIADPIQLYDCCPVSDGAAAVVVVAKDRAKGASHLPIDVLASVQTRGSPRIGGHQDIVSFDATVKAAQRAYQAAGMNPKDIDFVELHDCFSMAEIIDSEDLGLVPRGMGAEMGRRRSNAGRRRHSDQSVRRIAGEGPSGRRHWRGAALRGRLAAARPPCQPSQECRRRHDPQPRRCGHRLHGEHPEAIGCVTGGVLDGRKHWHGKRSAMQQLRHARCRSARDLPLLPRERVAAARSGGRW